MVRDSFLVQVRPLTMQFQTDELEFVQLADGFFLLLFFFNAPGTFQHSSRSVTYFRFHCSCSRQTCWVGVGGGARKHCWGGWRERRRPGDVREGKAPSSKIQVGFSRQRWLDGLRERR